jgi:hypothetical protein
MAEPGDRLALKFKLPPGGTGWAIAEQIRELAEQLGCKTELFHINVSSKAADEHLPPSDEGSGSAE